ncbi:MAG: hypothetical protein HY741_20630 [Chloroflexi bacterium]|nr:hypothetical protein [Chloroflexota bacterium]
MRYLKLAAILFALIALGLAVRPANAASSSCLVSPDTSAPVGTTFWIACDGYAPNVLTNVYAVEPDGRASGINIYGFFPTTVKADENGIATFYFVTEYPGFYSVPIGNYTFVIHALGLGNTVINEHKINIEVQSRAENNSTAWLYASVDDYVVTFWGGGFNAWEQANVWVTQPDGSKCSGLGIDQLSLGALGAASSSLWVGPETVKADADGNIAFTIVFGSSACIGEYMVTVRSPSSGLAGEAGFAISGLSVTEAGGAWIMVSPDSVPIYGSFFAILGYGYPANTVVNCWLTRPDGRVLSFLNQNVTTDGSGSFATGASLDDFPPYTSSEPGTWHATCATPDRSYLAITSFTGYGLATDP